MDLVKRILVVDDQEELREQFSKFLQRSGKANDTSSLIQKTMSTLSGKIYTPEQIIENHESYSVEIASQGEEAINMVASAVKNNERFMVIFLDMRMPPGIDGVETMEKIWKIDKDIQVVICTAYSDYSWEDIVERVGKRDNLLILKKPFDGAEISQLALSLTEKYIVARNAEEKTTEIKEANLDLQQQVSERRNAEKNLEYMRNFLNGVINSLSFMLISVNPQGRITHWNTACEISTGIPVSQAESKMIWEQIPFLAECRNMFARVMNRQQAEDIKRLEVDFRTGKRYMDVSIYPLIFESKQEGAVFRIDDVTETVKKDEHLRQAQKMDTVGNLAAGLAHDFKNVLGGIQGTLSSMKFAVSEDHPKVNKIRESLNDDFAIIEESANQGTEMIQQLLLLCKKKELPFSPADLNGLIANVVKICRKTIDKSIEIETEYYDTEAMVMAYPTQLEQVFLNLCVNASHAMTIMRGEDEPYGGVLTITISKITVGKNICATLTDVEPGDYWVINIGDTGVGMDEKTVDKIYEPFFTTKDKTQGTGLGLSMVYNIIRQHKGFIEIYSKPGEGTNFFIFLPFFEDKPSK